MLLAACAMALMGTIILSANSTILENDRVMMDSEFGVASISLATSLIEEVQGKLFDEAAIDSGIVALNQLTPLNSLGPETGEYYHPPDTSMTDFNDMDDFNNFWIEFVADTSKPQVATYRGDARGFRADYYVRAKVEYALAGLGVAYLNGAALPTTSWHKKLTVTVTSPSSRDSLVFPIILSYWN